MRWKLTLGEKSLAALGNKTCVSIACFYGMPLPAELSLPQNLGLLLSS